MCMCFGVHLMRDCGVGGSVSGLMCGMVLSELFNWGGRPWARLSETFMVMGLLVHDCDPVRHDLHAHMLFVSSTDLPVLPWAPSLLFWY